MDHQIFSDTSSYGGDLDTLMENFSDSDSENEDGNDDSTGRVDFLNRALLAAPLRLERTHNVVYMCIRNKCLYN